CARYYGSRGDYYFDYW
nr:immunoglobulin heavy chain junction region [Mus musculus]